MEKQQKIKLGDIDNKIVPKEHYLEPQKELRKKYTEWCCTKYKINDKIYITISILHPDCAKLMYINASGDQIIFNVDEKYEQYAIEKKYWYATD